MTQHGDQLVLMSRDEALERTRVTIAHLQHQPDIRVQQLVLASLELGGFSEFAVGQTKRSVRVNR